MDLWEIEFDRDYFRERLKFLSDFLEAQVAIMLNMKIGGPGPSRSNGPDGPKRQPPGTPQRPNHLLGNEAWTCPLCHLNHGNEKYNERPYLSVCQLFLEQSVDKRIRSCRSHKFCLVCTSSLTDRKHSSSQNGCPNSDRFGCKICQHPSCLLHGKYSCKAQFNQTPNHAVTQKRKPPKNPPKN